MTVKRMGILGNLAVLCALAATAISRADCNDLFGHKCQSSFSPRPYSQYAYWFPRWASIKGCLAPTNLDQYMSDSFSNVPHTNWRLGFPCPPVEATSVYVSPYRR